ncbi:MAG: ABC transporter permease [Candidatus Heimdallarchaeota archaeon]|nr:ABC transporter permease [Candidatus Heimdallarchaeota archaeon]
MDEQPIPEEKEQPKAPSKFVLHLKRLARNFYLSMRRIFTLIGGRSLRYFRSPNVVFWSIIYPIVLVLIFGAIFGRAEFQTLNLDVVDQDHSEQSAYFMGLLENTTTLKVNEVTEPIISPEEWLKENNRFVLLVIPPTWGVKLSLNLTANLTIYYDPSSYSAKTVIDIVNEVVMDYNILIMPIELKFGMDVEYNYVANLSYIDSLVPGIIMIAISTIALFTSVNYDLEEKESNFLSKLATTPLTRFELVFSRQLWQLLLVFIASTLVILFALIFSFNILSLHPLMLLFIIFGTLTFSGIGFILVRLISNPDGIMIVSILFLVPQIILSGVIIPLLDFPQFLRALARIFPLYYLTEGIRYTLMGTFTGGFWLHFALSAVFAFIFQILGILAIKWRD